MGKERKEGREGESELRLAVIFSGFVSPSAEHTPCGFGCVHAISLVCQCVAPPSTLNEVSLVSMHPV